MQPIIPAIPTRIVRIHAKENMRRVVRRVDVQDGGILAALLFAFAANGGTVCAQQKTAGVLPKTIRLSVSIEHVAGIIEDIDQALAKACPNQDRLEAAE